MAPKSGRGRRGEGGPLGVRRAAANLLALAGAGKRGGSVLLQGVEAQQKGAMAEEVKFKEEESATAATPFQIVPVVPTSGGVTLPSRAPDGSVDDSRAQRRSSGGGGSHDSQIVWKEIKGKVIPSPRHSLGAPKNLKNSKSPSGKRAPCNAPPLLKPLRPRTSPPPPPPISLSELAPTYRPPAIDVSIQTESGPSSELCSSLAIARNSPSPPHTPVQEPWRHSCRRGNAFGSWKRHPKVHGSRGNCEEESQKRRHGSEICQQVVSPTFAFGSISKEFSEASAEAAGRDSVQAGGRLLCSSISVRYSTQERLNPELQLRPGRLEAMADDVTMKLTGGDESKMGGHGSVRMLWEDSRRQLEVAVQVAEALHRALAQSMATDGHGHSDAHMHDGHVEGSKDDLELTLRL